MEGTINIPLKDWDSLRNNLENSLSTNKELEQKIKLLEESIKGFIEKNPKKVLIHYSGIDQIQVVPIDNAMKFLKKRFDKREAELLSDRDEEISVLKEVNDRISNLYESQKKTIKEMDIKISDEKLHKTALEVRHKEEIKRIVKQAKDSVLREKKYSDERITSLHLKHAGEMKELTEEQHKLNQVVDLQFQKRIKASQEKINIHHALQVEKIKDLNVFKFWKWKNTIPTKTL